MCTCFQLPALSAVGKYPSESPCSSPLTPLEDSTSQTLQYLLQQPLHPPVLLQSTGQHRDTMVKKRRSLQSILIPPFFYSTSSTETSPNHTTRLRSNSAAAATTHSPIPSPIPINPSQPSPSHSAHTSPRNSPPSDLLDDDPFANLTPGPSLITDSSHNRARSQSLALPRLSTSSGPSSEPPAVPTPRSPLSQNALPVIPSLASVLAENASSFQADVIPPAPPSTPPVPETHSRSFRGPWIPGQGQLRPAYTRPAFKPRPSLPSLRSLTEGQVVVPRVRSFLILTCATMFNIDVNL